MLLLQGNCLELLEQLDSDSVDMVLTDLPYGTTQNKWDSVINLDMMWDRLNVVTKENGAMVFTAAQPFTSQLVMSNPRHFKYDWVWQKNQATGFLNAKKQPLRDKEDVLVFYRKQCTYNPQMTQGTPYAKATGKKKCTSNYGKFDPSATNGSPDGKRYPKQVQQFRSVQRGTVRPTQKPVELMAYLIRTYTSPGDVVLDICMGSGTTGIAALKEGRSFIGMELDGEIFKTASDRIEKFLFEGGDVE